MKTLNIIFLFTFLIVSASKAQSNFMSGWEFLEWDMSPQQVEKQLSKNGIAYKPLQPNARLRATNAQNYKGFERLAFMYDTGLVQVQQYHNTNNRSEANRFVENLKTEFETAFGVAIAHEKNSSETHWEWIVGHTLVLLYLHQPATENGQYEIQVFYEKHDE